MRSENWKFKKLMTNKCSVGQTFLSALPGDVSRADRNVCPTEHSATCSEKADGTRSVPATLRGWHTACACYIRTAGAGS